MKCVVAADTKELNIKLIHQCLLSSVTILHISRWNIIYIYLYIYNMYKAFCLILELEIVFRNN